MILSHGNQCGFNLEQYPHECDCGLLRPMTTHYVLAEQWYWSMQVERAREQLAKWQGIDSGLQYALDVSDKG